MNAVSAAMFGVLMEQLDAVRSRQAARAVVLTGNGRGFCAGADLSAGGKLVENRDSIEEAMNRGVTRFLTELTELPVPVIAAVNGAAAGVGLGFALAADLVVCARSARFLTAFSRIGAVSTAAPRGRCRARSARRARSRWPHSPVTRSTLRPRSSGDWCGRCSTTTSCAAKRSRWPAARRGSDRGLCVDQGGAPLRADRDLRRQPALRGAAARERRSPPPTSSKASPPTRQKRKPRFTGR